MINFIETATIYAVKYFFFPVVIALMFLCGLSCLYMILGMMFGFVKNNRPAR
jgi:hypothetical protein